MAEKYEGPFCNIELATGDKHAIQGTREGVTEQLRDAQRGFAELVDVFGQSVTINPEHVVQVHDTMTYPARGGG